MKIGIDLGAKNVTVYAEGKGIVMNFPCVAAIDISDGKIITIGEDAQKMIGRNPQSMKIVHPFVDGNISDFETAETLIRHILKSTCKMQMMRPKVALSKPCEVSSFESAMLKKVAENAGARQVLLVDDALSSLIGADVDVNKANGRLTADIGAGTTSIAVVSMGQIAKAKTVAIAGNRFDNAIRSYVKHKHGIIIGELTSEEVKKNIGGVIPRKNEMAYVVKGQSTESGFPVSVEISSTELCPILSGIVDDMVFEIRQLLETISPQLSADVCKNGLVLTGGGSLLYGIDKYMQQSLKIPVYVANDPLLCAAKGMRYFLQNYESILNSDYKYDENGTLLFS